MNDDILTIPEVARYLRMSQSKVYNMVRRNEMPHFAAGKNVRVRREDLDRWIEVRINMGENQR